MELRLNKDVLQRLLMKTCWLLLRKLHKRTGKTLCTQQSPVLVLLVV
jgi:hypothetical protein